MRWFHFQVFFLFLVAIQKITKDIKKSIAGNFPNTNDRNVNAKQNILYSFNFDYKVREYCMRK